MTKSGLERQMQQQQRKNLRRGRGLIAFMQEAEAVQMMSLGEPGSVDECRAKYSSAVEALKSPITIPGTYVTGIGSEFNTYLNQVSSTPIFQQAFQGSNSEFKIVEIDNLTCYQRQVDLDYVGELQDGLSENLDPLSILKFCLPVTFPIKAAISAEPQSGAITIASQSPNVSVSGLSFGQSSPNAPPSAVFTLGVNANYVQVVRFQGRYIVKNGHHRLYALRALGQTTSPCVYSEIIDYSLTGGDRPGFFSRDTVLSQRPPRMADFFDDEVSANIKIQPTLNVIRIKAEQFPTPVPGEIVGMGA